MKALRALPFLRRTLLSAALGAALGCAGCVTVDYVPYQGAQQDWPTAKGSFIATVEGLPVYHGYPPRPYKVLGAVAVTGRPGRGLHAVILQARALGATAIILADQHTAGTDIVTLPAESTYLNTTTVSTGWAQGPLSAHVHHEQSIYWLATL